MRVGLTLLTFLAVFFVGSASAANAEEVKYFCYVNTSDRDLALLEIETGEQEGLERTLNWSVLDKQIGVHSGQFIGTQEEYRARQESSRFEHQRRCEELRVQGEPCIAPAIVELQSIHAVYGAQFREMLHPGDVKCDLATNPDASQHGYVGSRSLFYARIVDDLDERFTRVFGQGWYTHSNIVSLNVGLHPESPLRYNQSMIVPLEPSPNFKFEATDEILSAVEQVVAKISSQDTR